MLKILQAIILVSIIFVHGACTEEQLDQTDPYIQQISQFIIKLIDKYDSSKMGLLPIETYPLFLRDVFLEGSSLSEQAYEHSKLLLEATTTFTELKKEKKDEEYTKKKQQKQDEILQPDVVSIQQFYDDIIGKFTMFLMQNQKYEPIISTLFVDLDSGSEEKGEQKIQVQQL